jgi:hypothetical protein
LLQSEEADGRIDNLWMSTTIDTYLWNCIWMSLGLGIFRWYISWMVNGRAAVPCILRARRKCIVSQVAGAWGWKVGKSWPVTLVSKSIFMHLIPDTTWTVQYAAEFPIKECPIRRPSSKRVNLLTISSILILHIIRWALRVWMIGVRSSYFTFVALYTLLKKWNL